MQKTTILLSLRRGEKFEIWTEKVFKEDVNKQEFFIALVGTPALEQPEATVVPFAVVCAEMIEHNGSRKSHYVALEDNLKTAIGDLLMSLNHQNIYTPNTWAILRVYKEISNES